MTPSTEVVRPSDEYVLAEAARVLRAHGGTLVRWSTPLDNHDPARSYAHGYGVRYTNRFTGEPVFKCWPGNQIPDLARVVLLLDDGETVTPHFYAGGKLAAGIDGYELFEPFPTNTDGRPRPDNGQPVDYSAWVLGPRRAYHLKVTPHDPTA